ncbi:MAG: polymorphic toxin type 47 domain-containing protein [Myxococcota bacterium]
MRLRQRPGPAQAETRSHQGSGVPPLPPRAVRSPALCVVGAVEKRSFGLVLTAPGVVHRADDVLVGRSEATDDAQDRHHECACGPLEGKTVLVEWRSPNNAEVSIDVGHYNESANGEWITGPDAPRVGWQEPGKGGKVGHFILEEVSAGRPR